MRQNPGPRFVERRHVYVPGAARADHDGCRGWLADSANRAATRGSERVTLENASLIGGETLMPVGCTQRLYKYSSRVEHL